MHTTLDTTTEFLAGTAIALPLLRGNILTRVGFVVGMALSYELFIQVTSNSPSYQNSLTSKTNHASSWQRRFRFYANLNTLSFLVYDNSCGGMY